MLCLVLAMSMLSSACDDAQPSAVPDRLCGPIQSECECLIRDAVRSGRDGAVCFGTGFTSPDDQQRPWVSFEAQAGLSLGDSCGLETGQLGFVRAVIDSSQVSFEPAEVTALAWFLGLRSSPAQDERRRAYRALPDALREIVSEADYLECTANAPVESIVAVRRVALDAQGLWTEVTVSLAVTSPGSGSTETIAAITYLVRRDSDRFLWADAGLSCFPSEF